MVIISQASIVVRQLLNDAFKEVFWFLFKCFPLKQVTDFPYPMKIFVMFLQYLPHYAKVKTKRRVCDRFALLFTVAFVWGYAQILTSSGAYHNASSATQAICRTDRAGLITGAPW